MKIKNISILVSLIGISLLFVGCNNNNVETITSFEECVEVGGEIGESYPRQCFYDEQSFTKELSLTELCSSEGGTWIELAQECEFVSKEFCDMNGGVFNECGSACRNDPNAEICTLQCIPYCSFNDDKDKLGCENNGGKYEKYGIGQVYQCNMPTKDSGTSCTDSQECDGMCLAQNGTGVCSEWTINFGCINIFENSEEVTICID